MNILPIPGHITYGASRDGKIFCLRTERELIPQNDPGGYYRVYLTNKDGTKQYSVARLIGFTFIPNPDNKPEIDHIDRNRTNNSVDNLRWATDEEQAVNKSGWGKQPKYIHYEKDNLKNRTHASYKITIRNHMCKYSKRFDAKKYTIDDVVKCRNEILKQYNIPIID